MEVTFTFENDTLKLLKGMKTSLVDKSSKMLVCNMLKKITISVGSRVSIVTDAASTTSCDTAGASNSAVISVGISVAVATAMVIWRHYVVVVGTQ